MDITPKDFPYIPSNLKLVTEDDSNALGGTVGGLGSTPVAAVGDAINNDGTVNAENLTGAAPIGTVDIAARGWGQSCVFTLDGSAPSTTVNWSSGYLTSADGTSYAIDAGTTGVMAAKTYIYFYPDNSATTFQTTTTYTVAVGAGKVMVGVAQNGTVEATFLVFEGGELNINGSNIATGSLTAAELADLTITGIKIAAAAITAAKIQAGTITANEIAAGTITANEIAANTITANEILANTITANELATALIYAGSIEIDTAGNIRSGQTAYETGTGWFIGNAGGTAKISIGSADSYLKWDGTNIILKGSFDVGDGGLINTSSYTVANLPVVPTTAGFSPPTANESG